MIDGRSTFQIDRARIQFERFEDETVLINVENGFYYSISRSGSELLQLLDSGYQVAMLVGIMVDDSVDSVHYSALITRFVEDLILEGILIETFNSPTTNQSIDIVRPLYSSTEGFEPLILEKFDEVSDLLLIDPIHMVDQQQGWPKT